MNFSLKNLLGVLGVAACAWSFAGCESDAEEGSPAGRPEAVGAAAAGESNKSPVVEISATNSTAQSASNNPTPATNAVPASADSTHSAASTGAGTNAANQQVTVVKEVPPTPPAELQLSKPVQEVIKLAQSGVSETVVLLYIERSEQPFNLDAADIVYLNDIGVSNTVIAAMLNHDGAGPEVQKALTNTVDVASGTNIPVQTNVVATAPPAAPPVEVSSNYVAAAPPGGTVVQEPVVQQPVVVQQQPVIVQQPVVVTEPAVTYSYFYSSLSPYGAWIEVPDYGWCWRPTIAVVHSGWRPYCHGGRWLYSDAGWYWHSDYSWGWAPFHYGRWYCSPRFGWVWTPGYTWAPSWVTWRRGPDYCGWAPLPPHTHVRSGVGFTYWDHNVGFSFSFGLGREHYTFVPARHFYNRRVIDHVVPTDKTVNIYNNSTVVNNYIVGNNNTVINNGLPRDYVARHAGTEIRKISVRDEPRADSRRIAPDRLTRQGNELVVYRPTPPAPTVAAGRQLEARRVEQAHIASPQSTVASAATGRRGESRPGQALRNSPGAEAGTRGAVSSSSGFAARSEVPHVQFGTPPPVRPEPQPPAAIQPSRTALEARNSRSGRPVVPPASGNFPGTGLVNSAPASQTSPRPAEAIREPSGTREGRVIPQASNRSTPVPPSIIRPTTPSPARSEVVQGGFGAERPVASQPARSPDLSGGARNIPGAGLPGSMRPAAPNTVTPSAPAQRLEAINTPRNSMDIYRQTTRSQAPVSTPLHIQQNTPARSPDLVRPQTPSVPSGAGPSAVRPQPAPQSSVTVSPQPINPSAGGWNAPTPAGSPNIIRSETFGGRPVQAPVQTAPVIQSREMTPVAPRSIPVPQPSVSGGGVSQQALPGQFRAPPVNTAPAVNPAPAAGGRFNAAPVPAGRPAVIQSAPAQSSAPREGGRGRLEIGR